MAYRVFSQTAELDPVSLVRNSSRFFEAELEILAQPSAGSLRVRISSARRGYAGDFELTVRPKTSADDDDARLAEERSRAGGMAALARRCGHIWQITPDAESPSLLNLCAILASVALGPVMPDDASALFGVRGAMERVEALVGRSLAR
jgi:hypothetical protein